MKITLIYIKSYKKLMKDFEYGYNQYFVFLSNFKLLSEKMKSQLREIGKTKNLTGQK